MTALNVFPRPRRAELTGSGAPTHGAVKVVADQEVLPEGYELRVADGAIEIRHSDEAGLRYGNHTLSQLRQQFPVELPGVFISDWPDTANRAYMLDISRDRVPTMDTLRWLVSILSACRINQLQLYTEHTFAFAEHETVWRDASPMTSAEMSQLDRQCAEEGIELVPCLNVFGHMGPWLKHDRYRDRAECPEGFEVPVFGTHLGPLTLEPTQANADFALDLVREITATVSTDKVNICCDEAIELGMGRSEHLIAKRGKADVFVDHLLRLVNPLIEEGHDVMFWGDMFRRNPGPIERLPLSNATALAWQYDPPSEPGGGMSFLAAMPEVAEFFGFPSDIHLGFESQTRQLADAKYPFWVAPGTGSWNSLIGRWPHAQANLLDSIDVGLKAGAAGLLLTDWGDTGHMQPLSISILPIVYGAGLSWCAEQNRQVPVDSEVDRVIFGDESAGLAGPLARLGGLSDAIGRRAINASALFYDLLVDPPLRAFGNTTNGLVREVVDALDSAGNEVAAAALTCEQSGAIQAELQAAIRLARHGAWRSARQGGLDVPADSVLRDDLSEAIDQQRMAWLARSRPGGLEHSIGLLEPTLSTYE